MSGRGLLSKLAVARHILASCSNGPSVILDKLHLKPVSRVKLRNGLEFAVGESLDATWNGILVCAILDSYHLQGNSPDIIVDVGANIGAFSCFASQLYPKSPIYAFEPDARNYATLEANLQINRTVNVHPVAHPVTADGRKVSFVCDGLASHITTDQVSASVLQSVTLNSVIDWTGKRELFLKLDCEGAEGEILQQFVANRPPDLERITIGCEYHGFCPVPLEEMKVWLVDQGFSVSISGDFGDTILQASWRR